MPKKKYTPEMQALLRAVDDAHTARIVARSERKKEHDRLLAEEMREFEDREAIAAYRAVRGGVTHTDVRTDGIHEASYLKYQAVIARGESLVGAVDENAVNIKNVHESHQGYSLSYDTETDWWMLQRTGDEAAYPVNPETGRRLLRAGAEFDPPRQWVEWLETRREDVIASIRESSDAAA